MLRSYDGINFRDRIKLAIEGLAAERAAAGPAADGAGAVDMDSFGWKDGGEAADSEIEAETPEAREDDDIINF